MTSVNDTGRQPYYLTTAIAYPNANPHMGTAYEYVSTDVLARFKRLDGYDVRFLTGTDEHGIKMMQAAQQAGIDPADFARGNSDRFEAMQRGLGISFDRFIRTTDPDHIASSQAIWQAMEANGDIYLGSYTGWYSVRDEAYYAEDETEERDGVRVAIASGTEVTWTEEPSYFFRLSNYGDKLLAYYEQHPEFIGPDVRRNEVLAFVKTGLRDLSISRSTFDWGVPVPGDDAHVMYVWVDALTNYITGIGYPDVDSEMFRTYWPADVHIIGKDIIRFHAVYWPAFLMSAGIELPKRVFAHGFLFDRGKKMSKSEGTAVDPLAFAQQYGLDQMRYFLCREFTYGQDGSYSHEAVVTRINADLANELGNLAQRSLSMIAKNCDGAVPTPGAFSDADQQLLDRLPPLLGATRAHIEGQQLSSYLEELWAVLAETNRYFSAQQPWVLRKEDPARMATVLYVTAEVVRVVATLVQPVMPQAAGALLTLLGLPEQLPFAGLQVRLKPGAVLPAPAGVFPRYLDH
ncbi:MAG: methionine--tRNA ligase [Beutenbergiaceae bacterium]